MPLCVYGLGSYMDAFIEKIVDYSCVFFFNDDDDGDGDDNNDTKWYGEIFLFFLSIRLVNAFRIDII